MNKKLLASGMQPGATWTWMKHECVDENSFIHSNVCIFIQN